MKINGVTRSDILKRAWYLHRRRHCQEFGPCLSIAWSEAKNAQFHNWTHLPLKMRFADPEQHLADLKMAKMSLDMKDRWNQNDYAQMRAYGDEISQIERELADA